MQTEVEIFDCDLCEKKFTRKNNLKIHVAHQHQPLSKSKSLDLALHGSVKCSQCEKVFKTMSNLKMHLASRHQNEDTGIEVLRSTCDRINERLQQTLQVLADANKRIRWLESKTAALDIEKNLYWEFVQRECN